MRSATSLTLPPRPTGIWATSCALLARKRPAADVGFDEAGSHGVDRHTIRPQLSGQRAGESELRGLRRRVRHGTEYAAAPLGGD